MVDASPQLEVPSPTPPSQPNFISVLIKIWPFLYSPRHHRTHTPAPVHPLLASTQCTYSSSMQILNTFQVSKTQFLFCRNWVLKIRDLFFFLREKKGDSCVAVIVPRPMVHLGKPMGITSLNRSSETPNSHTPQALLVFETYQKLQLQPSRELEPGMW